MPALPVFVGYDPAEAPAHAVTVRSLLLAASSTPHVLPLVEPHLRGLGLYWRRHQRRSGRLYDAISDVPMSTATAQARFLVPWLARHVKHSGWALYCDGDMLWRGDVNALAGLVNAACAVMVVQHGPVPAGVKKDGVEQRAYPRKGWSSLVLWNLDHPAHKALSLEAVNTASRDWLHAFGWLDDALVGALPFEWNWLAGVAPPVPSPMVVHYTLGTPDRGGAMDAPFADEWRARAAEMT